MSERRTMLIAMENSECTPCLWRHNVLEGGREPGGQTSTLRYSTIDPGRMEWWLIPIDHLFARDAGFIRDRDCSAFRPSLERPFGHQPGHRRPAAKHTWRCQLARKDSLLRLHSRLVARRDALRKALTGDLDAYREYAALNVVGDSVDAAVDTANDEISSQIVEIESRELRPDRARLATDCRRRLRPMRVLRRQDRRGTAQRLAVHEHLHRLPARERTDMARRSAEPRKTSAGRRSTTNPCQTPMARRISN